MKRVFNFKEGQFWDGDEDIIYAIFEMLCDNRDMEAFINPRVKRDTKIIIISETKKKTKKNEKIRM